MTSAIIVLLLVAAVVALSIVRPGSPAEFPAGTSRDRDAERQLAELRAIAGHGPDHSAWNAVSRDASTSTSRRTSRANGWNDSHRTSPSV